ncbi:hypothetical protein RMATCC62417_00971 [Rhizopus microsporus]|nr:hypothetical protein RMATCC62417_00971 [Rhizopus microsporus]
MSTEMQSVFEAFDNYSWDSDPVFQAGYQSIMASMPADNTRLLKAKHFYFSKFQQSFDLDAYLQYEKEKKHALYERVEDYDYENDETFVKGLPEIIKGYVEQQKKGLWDKDKLEFELRKAKAFYYHAKVEQFDIPDYFNYITKKQDSKKPACPFANLWQNKGTVQTQEQINGASFVVAEEPKFTGAIKITLSSPTSKNILSIDRLDELQRTLERANDDHVTCMFLTATVYDSPTLPKEMIETNDTKMICCGLPYEETSRLVSGSDLRQTSLFKISSAYYDLVRKLLTSSKPTVCFLNGQIPLNAAHLFLLPKHIRLITEHALLNLGLDLSHSPIPPLTTLKSCSKASVIFYLAMAPPVKLRGPELLYLGLADFFVPELKLSDAFDTARTMAICTVPDQAVRLALGTRHTYAGPNRITVWQDQIEQVFESAESFESLKSQLESIHNKWADTILDHWNSLPPTLLKVVFRAVKQMDTMEPIDVLELEQKLNAKWRQTEDYKEWLRSGKNWSDEEDVEFYFTDLTLPSLSDGVVYQAPVEQESQALVCPVTGQTASSCPVAGVMNKA